MIRNPWIAPMIVVLVATATIGLVRERLFREREVTRIEAEADSLGRVAAASDVLVAQIRAQATTEAARADSIAAVVEALERDLGAARARIGRTVVRVDSARATVDEDTLSAGLRNLLVIEREMAESYRVGWGLERRLREEAVAELTRIRPMLEETRSLLFTVQEERNAFQAALEDALDQLRPSFWKSFLLDLPELGAATGAGAVVAAVNDGDVLLGAGIGLAAGLVIRAVF